MQSKEKKSKQQGTRCPFVLQTQTVQKNEKIKGENGWVQVGVHLMQTDLPIESHTDLQLQGKKGGKIKEHKMGSKRVPSSALQT